MKYYRILFLAAAVTGLASCAMDELKDYEVQKPQSIEQYEYLNEYDVLKNYVDRTASPDFKLGAALAASDFTAHGQVYALAVSNFDEMTAGNDMKYASIVGNDGTMSFDNVRNFINAADEAGMTVYGHTLAWHSQQNNKYLNGLIKDKELEIDPNATDTVVDAAFDYTTMTSWNYWGQGPDGSSRGIVDGVFQSHLPEAIANFWEFQYHVADGIPWVAGTSYKITMMIRASAPAKFTLAAGTWDGQAGGEFEVGTEWQEVTVTRNISVDGNGFVMFQSGNFAGTIEMQWLKVTHEVAKAVEVEVEATSITYTDGPFPFYAMGCEPPVIGGYMHYEPNGSWNQFFIMPGANNTLTEGDHVVYLTMKADVDMASGVQLTMQNGWGGTDQNVTVGVSVKAGEHEYRLVFNDLVGGNYDVILKPQTAEVVLDVKGMRVCKVEKLNSIPLTPEEKKDTLTWAMDNWIKGMMEVTAEKVSAWDVVNEAIAGVDGDGDGWYDLQSAANGDAANNFYWQDYLGNEEYVRLVVAKARQYYAEFGGTAPLKLFINDYNLESDWDDNKKLKSLIHWIEVWEADGVTKIDGIATQMHVSCYANPEIQASKEEHVVNMLELMAATGKLVKISELDMGFVDADGNTVPTSSMTEEQHQKMAAYYEFIVSKYLEIVPASQQYGITQWCITDAAGDLGTGWRGGEPVGLWDQNYNRKHTYAGFAAGLQK